MKERQAANERLIRRLNETIRDGRASLAELQKKIRVSYYVIITFLASQISLRSSYSTLPDRVHSLMANMGQLTLVLGGYQTEVGLRLLEMDVTNPLSIGKAAREIENASEASVVLIQNYIEVKNKP